MSRETHYYPGYGETVRSMPPREKERQRLVEDREAQRRALRMWARKVPVDQIARELGVSGYVARGLVKRGLENLDVPEAAERRKQENDALDQAEAVIWGVIARPGYRISNAGTLVADPEDPNGRPLVDQPTRLAAVGTLVRIQERRARLNGLDAPSQVDVTVSLEAAIRAVEVLEREADKREAELARVVALPSGRRKLGRDGSEGVG